MPTLLALLVIACLIVALDRMGRTFIRKRSESSNALFQERASAAAIRDAGLAAGLELFRSRIFSRDIRILYVGPGLAGVTTSVTQLAQWLEPEEFERDRRRGFEVQTRSEQRLEIRSDVRTNLGFANTRAAIAKCRAAEAGSHESALLPLFEEHQRYLGRADGIVFVADSQGERFSANLETLRSLEEDLRHAGRAPNDVPLVFQCNKRDVNAAAPMADLLRTLEWPRAAYIPSNALLGHGVIDALNAVLDLILAA